MTTPVYIVEGFLGSGKTKLIENSLRLRHCRNVLIFQFEEGEECNGRADDNQPE